MVHRRAENQGLILELRKVPTYIGLGNHGTDKGL